MDGPGLGSQAPDAGISLRAAIPQVFAQLQELEAQRSELDREKARLLIVLEWAQATVNAHDPLRTQAPPPPADADAGHGPGTSVTTGGASDGGSIPQRVLVVANAAPDRTWTVREFSEQLLGGGASRSQLETVRKSALRLVERGKLTRVDTKHFQSIAKAVGS